MNENHGRTVVLLVEPDCGVRGALRDFLTTHGFAVLEAASHAETDRFGDVVPEAVLIDVARAGDGSELVRHRRVWPDAAILVLTDHGAIDFGVKTLAHGADQFLTKPVDLPVMLTLLERALEHRRSLRHRRAVAWRTRVEPDPFAGTSPAIRALAEEARHALLSPNPVLITGEPGSGRSVLALWIHRHGPRAQEPFVELHAAGVARDAMERELFGQEKDGSGSREGMLEVAHRGTLFLDEVGELEAGLQGRLLRALEDRRVRRPGGNHDRAIDVRFVAGSRQPLAELVQQKRFRAELAQRFAIHLHVPALRERREDIGPLATHLLEGLSADMGRAARSLAPAAVEWLSRRSWPGNVRELRNLLERAVLRARGPELELADLTGEALESASPESLPADWEQYTLDQLERLHIDRVLRQENGQVERAAARLGIGRSTLYHKLKTLGP